MREIASIELHLAIAEMKGAVEGSYINKFYDLGNDSFRFNLRKPGRATNLYVKLGKTFNETEFVEAAGEATNFTMAVRKRIENARISGMEQHGADRIVVIGAEKKDEKYRIIIEMFGKGNLIITDSENRILLSQKVFEYRDRSVRKGNEYVFPESGSVGLDNVGEREIDAILEGLGKEKGKLIVALSRYLNIGPLYLEEIINDSSLDPKREVRDNTGTLASAIARFFEAVKSPRPRAYTKDGNVVDFAVIPIKKYDGLEFTSYETVNKLLDGMGTGGREQAADTGRSRAIDELEANAGKQRALLAETLAASKAWAESGRKIFENMHVVNQVIEYMKANKHADAAELKEKFRELRIKSVDLKKKTFTIELE